MILENLAGTVRIFIGADRFLYQRTKVAGKWTQPVKHFNQYNGLMLFNECLYQLGWKSLAPIL